jgi:hypothetical protein
MKVIARFSIDHPIAGKLAVHGLGRLIAAGVSSYPEPHSKRGFGSNHLERRDRLVPDRAQLIGHQLSRVDAGWRG